MLPGALQSFSLVGELHGPKRQFGKQQIIWPVILNHNLCDQFRSCLVNHYIIIKEL